MENLFPLHEYSPDATNQSENKNINLCIFGYSSKLYRDDQKAIKIDEGEHLISWWVDENIKIDRYDVRGYLNDLSQYEGESTGYELTSEEIYIEKLCDNERYNAIFHNEEELEMYKEEEFKRTKRLVNSENKYGQVSYNYDSSKASEEVSKHSLDDFGLRSYFTPMKLLNIPSNVILPTSYNMSQIIEKTAIYVAEHGRQMEIIIKARQGNNEKFEFLNNESSLNPYYEYILSTIKDGKYKMESQSNNRPVKDNSQSYKAYSDYIVESAPTIPEVVYKQSQSCPYSLLVNNIYNLQRDEEGKRRKGRNKTDSMPTSYNDTQMSETNITKVSKNTQIMIMNIKSKHKYKTNNTESYSYRKMVNGTQDCNRLMKVTATTLNAHCPTIKDSNCHKNRFQSIIETSILNEQVEYVSNDLPPNYINQNYKATLSPPESQLKILKHKKCASKLESLNSNNISKTHSLQGRKDCVNIINKKSNKYNCMLTKTTGIRFYIKSANHPAKLVKVSPLPVDSSSDEGDSLLEDSLKKSLVKHLDIKNKTYDQLQASKMPKQPLAESYPNLACNLENEQRKLERRKRAKALVKMLKSNQLKIKVQLKK